MDEVSYKGVSRAPSSGQRDTENLASWVSPGMTILPLWPYLVLDEFFNLTCQSLLLFLTTVFLGKIKYWFSLVLRCNFSVKIQLFSSYFNVTEVKMYLTGDIFLIWWGLSPLLWKAVVKWMVNLIINGIYKLRTHSNYFSPRCMLPGSGYYAES